MDAAPALERLGGTAGARDLLRLTTRRRLRRAVARGRIVRLSRGRYALPTADDTRRMASRLTAIVCLRSAAAHHGWALKEHPRVPELMVRRGRKLSAEQREGVSIHWANIADDQVVDGVTTPLRTVIDCARHLPFDEALAVADSALRSGLVTRADLDSSDVRGAGADAVRRVLRHADRRAANPFESVLRALCIEAGFVVEPQAAVDLGTGTIHPDLVCRVLRMAFEADSWSFHASRRAHRRDCARYNLLVINGWRVLRFTWEQVMHDQAYVRWVLAEALRRVGRPEVQAVVGSPAQAAAAS
jgi:very-short-patch-repair endonuclease